MTCRRSSLVPTEIPIVLMGIDATMIKVGLIQTTIKEKGRFKVIDQVSVALNEKTDSYEATFEMAISASRRVRQDRCHNISALIVLKKVSTAALS